MGVVVVVEAGLERVYCSWHRPLNYRDQLLHQPSVACIAAHETHELHRSVSLIYDIRKI